MMTYSGPLDFLSGARVLITGGTGSLGQTLTRLLLDGSRAKTIIIFSRDEYKQYLMQAQYTPEELKRLRFFLGDVREADRLRRAMDGVDYVIHAAALKHVPASEYNPFEFVKTNVMGAENVISACLDAGVKRAVALSTDKAANPINLYGATKLCSDKLFVAANNYSGRKPSRFAVVRYGNVVGSRGSVVPFFLRERKKGVLPITDARMTRFWITIEQGAWLVFNALRDMSGGEIYVPRIPSMRVDALARAIAPECELKEVGIRPGEKLHEVMITTDDGRTTIAFDTHLLILPQQTLPQWAVKESTCLERGGVRCPPDFYFGSDNNTQWLENGELSRMIANLDLPEAKEWAAERGLA
jgi:UDP-N-acetylglucosamine 4,6-dehydratase/5-epimerase